MTNAKTIVRLLNEMLSRDRAAISCLFLNRVPANKSLAKHPLINIWSEQSIDTIGILGVLNGVLQEFEIEQISMVINEQYPETILFFECCDPRMPLAKGQKNPSFDEFESPSTEK